MIRLLKIEFLKLKAYKPFWILTLLYGAIIIGLGLWVPSFLDWWTEQGANFQGILPNNMPIFEFDDVWQNITFLGRFFLPLLAFLIITIVNNEFTFNTQKQNIIDGMSRLEWFASKLIFLLIIAAFATVLHFIVGYYLGSNYSSVQGSEYVLKNIAFIPAYTLQALSFLSLGMLIVILIRKSILSFGILLLLYWPGEQLIRYFLPDSLDGIHFLFPIKSMMNVIPNPFPKYIFMEADFNVDFQAAVIQIGYILLFWALSYFIIKKRDI
jgi:ABC-type transport system involved in multi-copper enzyme maturation permease subunit